MYECKNGCSSIDITTVKLRDQHPPEEKPRYRMRNREVIRLLAFVGVLDCRRRFDCQDISCDVQRVKGISFAEVSIVML